MMSLWWAKKEQLDDTQLELIEELPLQESHLVLGPPGSGKTNVLLRRAQFVRTQNMPNVMVLTFTRSLTEFIKTGCFDAQGREIFPSTCVSTLEGWIRGIYGQHDATLPDDQPTLALWKSALASGAIEFVKHRRIPRYDALFVDEAQDLMPEEVDLVRAWSPVAFFVGDDRQKIYEHAVGLEAVRAIKPRLVERTLPFHYRLAREICEMADKIQVAQGDNALAKTSHYAGPKPGRIGVKGPLDKKGQVAAAAHGLKAQLRAYGDLIKQGDRIGIVVPRKDDREYVYELLERDAELRGMSQVIRARTGNEDDNGYSPEFDPDRPISILTEQGSKGLEFRAVHWLFCDDLAHVRRTEVYYTVVTRAKTSLDLYHGSKLPQCLARSYSPPVDDIW